MKLQLKRRRRSRKRSQVRSVVSRLLYVFPSSLCHLTVFFPPLFPPSPHIHTQNTPPPRAHVATRLRRDSVAQSSKRRPPTTKVMCLIPSFIEHPFVRSFVRSFVRLGSPRFPSTGKVGRVG